MNYDKYTEQEVKTLRMASKILMTHATAKNPDLFRSSDTVADLFRFHLTGEQIESVAVLYLDIKCQGITIETISTGTINQCFCSPREICRRALHHNASCIIIGHNHPTGETTPSDEDINITKKLKIALEMFEITLLDHIIVGRSYTSLQALGLMD